MQRVLVAGLVIVFGAAQVHAQAASGIVLDNDFFITFNPKTATDHEYTHGTIIWMESPNLRVLPRMLPRLVGCRESPVCLHRLALAQKIYTPRREGSEPVPGERPHAGWLTITMETKRGDADARTAFALEIGVVGAASFAEETQEAFHHWFGFHPPTGWAQQLPFEPIIQAAIRRQVRAVSFRIGSFGLTGEYGLGSDVGTSLIRSSADVSVRACLLADLCSFAPSANHRVSVEVAGLFGYRVVLRDMLLDGTVSSSNRVTRRALVPSAAITAGLRARRFGLAYSRKWRGREYATEPAPFTYGSIEIQYNW